MYATFIGQASLILGGARGAVIIDPYLFDTCAERHGEHFRRLRPPGVDLGAIMPVSAVLLTHEHDDHADPASVSALLERFPGIPVIGPAPAVDAVRAPGVWPRALSAGEGWIELAAGIRAIATPAAHPKREVLPTGEDRWCGYVVEIDGVRAWHSGDTCAHEDASAAVRAVGSVSVAFLPVNERNHVRERLGILGNMSPREAFALADDAGVPEVVPVHWDLFACNSTSRAEVEAAHAACGCRTALRWMDPGDSATFGGRVR
jgi:L-ascorbate metabolism protein UlaG (beta-lactamase superfamily)